MNRHLLHFCCCDLDLDFDPMTFIYELDPFSVETHLMYKYELPTSTLSKASILHDAFVIDDVPDQ